jgi:hypothetical protein
MPNPTMKKGGNPAAKQALKDRIMQVMQPPAEPAPMPEAMGSMPRREGAVGLDKLESGMQDYRDYAEYKQGRWVNSKGEEVDPVDQSYKFIGTGAESGNPTGQLQVKRGKYAKTGM